MIIYLDHAVSLQTTLQDIASPGMYGLVALNGFVFQYLILIMVMVGGLLFNAVSKFQFNVSPFSAKYYSYNVPLELFWTMVPTIILLSISLRSFNLLYFMDSIPYADLTVKVIGHQWYWTYEYPSFSFIGGKMCIQLLF